MTSAGRAAVVGTGLIGGSIGLALRARGWHVVGTDRDPGRAARALELGALDQVAEGTDAADITFVATPVGSVAEEARRALAAGGVVTDAGGVKGPIVPNSVVHNSNTYGVLKLTLHPMSFDWQFLPDAQSGNGTFTDAGSRSCH